MKHDLETFKDWLEKNQERYFWTLADSCAMVEYFNERCECGSSSHYSSLAHSVKNKENHSICCMLSNDDRRLHAKVLNILPACHPHSGRMLLRAIEKKQQGEEICV